MIVDNTPEISSRIFLYIHGFFLALIWILLQNILNIFLWKFMQEFLQALLQELLRIYRAISSGIPSEIRLVMLHEPLQRFYQQFLQKFLQNVFFFQNLYFYQKFASRLLVCFCMMFFPKIFICQEYLKKNHPEVSSAVLPWISSRKCSNDPSENLRDFQKNSNKTYVRQ